MNFPGISVCISLRVNSPIWASDASLARTRERGAERPLPLAASPLVRSREARFTRPIGELARRLCIYLNLLPQLRASVVGPSQAITSPKATANFWHFEWTLTDGPA